jgi:hypothetical protein
MEKIKNFIKESKAIILIVIGVLTALVTVLNTTEEVIESIPAEVEVAYDSIRVDTIK